MEMSEFSKIGMQYHSGSPILCNPIKKKIHASQWELCTHQAALLEMGLAVGPLKTPHTWVLDHLWPSDVGWTGVLVTGEQPQGEKQDILEHGTECGPVLGVPPLLPRQTTTSGQFQLSKGDVDHFEEGISNPPLWVHKSDKICLKKIIV